MPFRILVAILVLLPAGGALAGPDAWECHGPWGGLSLRITLDPDDPDRALLMTARGYRFTEDAGGSWRNLELPGSTQPPPMRFARGRIWCSHDRAIRVSRDGRKWEADGPVRGTVFAVGEATGGGPLYAVSAERGKGGTVSLRILEREDFGWKPVAAFTEAFAQGAFPSVALRGHPDHGKVLRVFVTDLDLTDATIAYGSDDGGKTWQRWSFAPRLWDTVPLAGPGVRFGGLALHAKHPPKGLFLTEDGGRTWKQASTDPRLTRLRSIAVGPGRRLLLGSTKEHILDTTPKLEEVKVLDSGLVNESVSALAIHPKDPKRIWAGTQCGLFRSDDGGQSFVPAQGGLAAAQLIGLAATGGRVLAFEFHQGLRVSEDGARSWKPVDLEWRNRFGKVFLVVARGDVIAASTGAGQADWRITISRNGGKSWSMRRSADSAIATGIGPKGEVYVTRKGGALQRIVEGVHLEGFTSGSAEIGGEVHAVRVLAGGKRLLMLGAAGAATCDAADGANRKLIEPPVSEPLAWPGAVLDEGDALYVSDRRNRLFRKVLPAGAWENVTPEGGDFVAGIATDPAVKGGRIAAFRNGLVARSADGGRTWTELRRFGTCGPIVAGKGGRVHVVADGAVWTYDPAGSDEK